MVLMWRSILMPQTNNTPVTENDLIAKPLYRMKDEDKRPRRERLIQVLREVRGEA